jgi:hypothetical protein
VSRRAKAEVAGLASALVALRAEDPLTYDQVKRLVAALVQNRRGDALRTVKALQQRLPACAAELLNLEAHVARG